MNDMDDSIEERDALTERVMQALSEVIDPEVGIDVVALGLVYEVTATRERVHVRMTMTSPACPMGGQLADEALDEIRARLPEIDDVEVELVWDPPWDPSRMSETAREFFGWPDT
jgi:metal-sulfur cluster biosynthetic enzyme